MLSKVSRSVPILFCGIIVLIAIFSFSWNSAIAQSSCDGDGVYLYEGSDFKGSCYKFTESLSDFSDIAFNASASSIKFAGSYSSDAYRVVLCEYRNYTGICQTIFEDHNNLVDEVLGDNNASSILIETKSEMAESMRIGTYNVQFRPWIPGTTTNACCEDINDRVRKLAERIIESEYDVIVLNEAFTSDIQDGLVEHLSTLYPHYISHIDGEGKGCIAFDLCQDSGLMIFSRFPFEPFPTPLPDAYKPEDIEAFSGSSPWNEVAFLEFGTNCNHSDCYSNKGAGYVRIRNPRTDRIYNVIFTHLQAEKGEVSRRTQLDKIRLMIESLMTSAQIAEEDIFFLGDLNFIGTSVIPPTDREEWNDIAQNDEFYGDTLQDVWEFQMHPTVGELPYPSRDPGGTSGLEKTPKILWAGGSGWGADNYPTRVAFGDVDGDGIDELGLTRKTDTGFRFKVFDDQQSGFNELFSDENLMTDWEEEDYATSIAFGDVDGDGRAEMGVTRTKFEKGWAKYWIFDDAEAGFKVLHDGGHSWGENNYPTDIAFGDIDGDGKDEFGLTRKANQEKLFRFSVFDDAQSGFQQLFIDSDVIGDWGDGDYATSIDFGDVDGDGRDEMGVARKKFKENRAKYWIFDDSEAEFEVLHSGGYPWGEDNYPTDIAFGDIDGDGKDEFGLTRKTDRNFRFGVYDDAQSDFQQLFTDESVITDWDSGDYATSISFGDIDNDGVDEFGVTRAKSQENRAKYWVFDDIAENFKVIFEGGRGWGEDNYPVSIDIGNISKFEGGDVVLSRITPENNKFFLHSYESFNNQLPKMRRLDYLFHNAPEQDSRLCIQHMSLGYNMRYGASYSEGSVGTIGNQDLSDHYALNADISRYAPYCNPSLAWVNPPLDSRLAGEITYPGSVQWLRIDEPGTYTIQVESDNPAVDFQVYKSLNLSAPLLRHDQVVTDSGWTYSISGGVFYIKVFSKERSWTGDYRIVIHHHHGDSLDDAIMLLPSVSQSIELPQNKDSIWFRIETETPDSRSAQNLNFIANNLSGDNSQLRLELRNSNGERVIEQSQYGQPRIARNTAEDNSKLMFLVIQRNQSSISEQIEVRWETNLTVLYGSLDNPLKLQCLSQTDADSFGNDDEISLSIYSDGSTIIESEDLGDFDTGQIRNLRDVVNRPIRFLDTVRFKLIEEDSIINPDDELTSNIASVAADISGPNQRGIEILEEDGSDGAYYLRYNLSHHSPLAAYRGTQQLDEIVASDLSVSITDGPESIINGQMIAYSIIITNSSPTPSYNTQITITSSSGLQFIDEFDQCAQETVDIFVCNIGEVPAMGTVESQISFNTVLGADAETELAATVAVSVDSITNPDLNSDGNTNSIELSIIPPTSLDIIQEPNPNMKRVYLPFLDVE